VAQQFDTSWLVGQFVLSRNKSPVPESWATERIGSWLLRHHPSLPAIRLLGVDDRPVGWLLGYPIDEKGKLLDGRDVLQIPGLTECLASTDIEQFVYNFGGRYLVAIVGVQQPRLYLDPCGSLSVVYCVHQEIVASTPNLIPYDEQTSDRVDLNRAMGIPYTNAMYPLELTPRHNVERLLPNHYLDLSQWKRIRHWPMQPLHSEGSVDEAITAIAAILKRNMSAVVSRTPTYLWLTAGADSRVLLACARDEADSLELLTFPLPDDGAYLDTIIARKIAQRFGLRHFVPRFQRPKQEDLDEWMFRIGYSTGELRGWQASTTIKKTDRAHANLTGNMGEVGRAYYCRKDESETSIITAARLLEHCLVPYSTLTISPLQRWLETVPAADAIQLLDLFYIEQRMGCWAGIWPYAQSGNPGFMMFPMCHREIIERMLTLPISYRRSDVLLRDIIAREWPELLEWPFNKPFGLLHISLAVNRTRRFFGKALRDPRRAADKIRERLVPTTG